jgi:flagellar L-ring protein FlgH
MRVLRILCISTAVAIALAPVEASKDKKKKKEEPPPPVVTEIPVKPTPTPVPAANGSLFTADAAGANLLGDFKARRVGDLVFVDVTEESDAKVTSGATRKRESGTLGGIGTLAGALPIPGAAVAGTVIGALGQRKHEGSGETERTSELNSRITARVVEVLPNGDLRITAHKMVKINKENEYLALSGIVRQNDLDAQNTIPTTHIGDLRVELNGKGVASADNAPGWLFRFFERVTPF